MPAVATRNTNVMSRTVKVKVLRQCFRKMNALAARSIRTSTSSRRCFDSSLVQGVIRVSDMSLAAKIGHQSLCKSFVFMVEPNGIEPSTS